MYYKTKAYRLFSSCNYLFLALLAFLCLLPLIHTLALSFSGRAPANANLVGLWPVDFTFDAYKKTFNNPNFLHSIRISLLRTLIGTASGMLMIFLAAYPLSKSNLVFKSRSVYSWFFIMTMLFNGGLVPNYIVVQKLGLMNSIWALILPVSVSVWLLVLMLNFFRNVPKELEEAALMDGASQPRILFMIFLPISMPAVATLSLFMMVFHWNSWFDGLIYITDSSKYPLSTFLHTILIQIDATQLSSGRDMENISNQTVKAAQIFIGALPILLVYPFLQRYFVKGIVLGSVKE
ncbi:carbohydrate ABC transporter permease [Paenibacillus sp. GCM10027626]|uniref:carbohydrate ABC transporter permease n=1 Tax=Paenibacillus sp. GCM10027626 TaxID=3273411 RepID=UPI00363CB56B